MLRTSWDQTEGAELQRLFCGVFCEKKIAKPKPIVADFVGISVPDRYVFGYGMDVSGMWRNLPAVHAVKGM